MKIRIVASSSSDNWYSKFIGQELDVVSYYDSNRGGFYVIKNTSPIRTVLACDAEEIRA